MDRRQPPSGEEGDPLKNERTRCGRLGYQKNWPSQHQRPLPDHLPGRCVQTAVFPPVRPAGVLGGSRGSALALAARNLPPLIPHATAAAGRFFPGAGLI
jgi:hypothetical protein